MKRSMHAMSGQKVSERSVHCGCLNAIDQRVPSLVSLPSIIIQQSIFLRCILPHFDWHWKHRYHRRRRPNTKYNYVYIDFMHAIHFSHFQWKKKEEAKHTENPKPNRPWRKQKKEIDGNERVFDLFIIIQCLVWLGELINQLCIWWMNEYSLVLIHLFVIPRFSSSSLLSHRILN